MRLQKVAYKKVAAHLEKTELACRLHYHQLSHGGNRGKRTHSLSSSSSASSPGQTPLDLSGSRTHLRFSPINPTGAIQKPSSSSTASKIKGKPLLPKRKQSPGKSKLLRCDTGSIDRETLEKVIIEVQNKVFWVQVASQYGGSYTPEYLEQYWNNGLKPAPPTRAISPQSKAGSPVSTCSPEEVSTPDIMKSINMEPMSELSTPQPLNASEPATPAASTEPAQVDTEVVGSTSSAEESQPKTEPGDHIADVTMNDILEAGESPEA